MIISVHLPKTAGSSFKASLIQYFDQKVLLDYDDFPINTTPFQRNRNMLNSSLEKAVRKFVNITGLSTILPPILITYNFSIKYFTSICLLSIIFPTTPLVLPKPYWTLLWSPNYLDHLIFRHLTPHFFSLADSASLLHY